MTTTITIIGYDQPDNCEHCGRHLIHGVRTDTFGVIGADCFVRLIKADKRRYGGNGKPTASMVRDYAKLIERRSPERLAEMGYRPTHFQFELKDESCRQI